MRTLFHSIGRGRCWRLALFSVAAAPLLAAGGRSPEAILAGAGDIAKCGSKLENAHATAEIIERVLEEAAGAEAAVFTLGDNVYPSGKAEEYEECYEPTWGRFKHRTRPAPGNHDYRTGGGPYYEYFGEAAGPPGKGYYSYTLGEWRIFVLNTLCDEAGCEPGSPQYQWLERELQGSGETCALAYMHHPRFSSGKHGPEDEIDALFRLLYEHGADVVIGGHDHNYERFAPLDPDGRLDEERGIRQFVAGTGGREQRKIRGRALYSEVRSNESFGVLKLTLRPQSYEWEFIPIEPGGFRDSGSAECH